MVKRLLTWLLAFLLPLTALAEEARRVFLAGETEPFPADENVLTLRVCPLLGADSMLLTLGEHSMLIDAGKKTDLDAIHAMLDDAGLTAVEYVFLSHPHVDHAGCVALLADEGFGMGTFFNFFPYDYRDQTPDAQRVLQVSSIQALQRAQVPIVDLKTEDTIPFGAAQLTVYRLPEERITANWECNNLSAMLMIRYGECSLLLTADVENRVQPILAELYDLKADILKYPHHGTVTAHSAFLSDVAPEYVFFTHGTKDTLDAQKNLLRLGYPRMSFATWGQITLQTDGEKWIVRQDIKPELQNYARKYKPGQ